MLAVDLGNRGRTENWIERTPRDTGKERLTEAGVGGGVGVL